MNDFEWEEVHYKDLTKQEPTVLEQYEAINRRGQLARQSAPLQIAPKPISEQEEEPVVTLGMKRFMFGGGFTTFCVCVIAAAEQGAFVAIAQVGAWVIGGAVLLRFVIAVLFEGISSGQNNSNQGATQAPQNINVTVNVAGQNNNTK